MGQQLTNILLESGTNELEFIEFVLYSKEPEGEETVHYFGINVAKVREIIKAPPITDVPRSNPYIQGMVNIRGKVIPMINLPKWLNLENSRDLNKVIITEFNEVVNGFLVNEVTRIYRISWKDVMQPEELAQSDDKNCITSVVRMGDKLILLLDFEKIIGDIFPGTYFSAKEDITFIESAKGKKILIAEDSPGIRKMLVSTLKKVGYKVIEAENGSVALKYIMDSYREVIKNHKNIHEFLDAIITDLEMPLLDGGHLIKRIRELPEFEKIPILVFSSMASEENKRKILELGADIFISKPELPRLVNIIEEQIAKRR